MGGTGGGVGGGGRLVIIGGTRLLPVLCSQFCIA